MMVGDRSLLDRAPGETIQILDEKGSLCAGATLPSIDDGQLLEMYRHMRTARRFDERMINLQRRGQLGTYPALAGQEGAQIGSMYALDDTDILLYQYREHAIPMVRDVLTDYVRYWMGYEAGNRAIADVDIFPLNISIASHIPHATGLAWAAKYKNDDRVIVCHFGEGATSEGDFHEGLNFAGVFDTPNVFLCHNNGWAISVPRARQTASETIAEKACSYGISGVRVDGMDPIAVYAVTKAAVDRARTPAHGEIRPTLIETECYRYGAHTTADDPTRYRSEREVDMWRSKDPIIRMKTFLMETGRLGDEHDSAIEVAIDDRLDEILSNAIQGVPNPMEMFEYTYETPTPQITGQGENFRAFRDRYPDDSILRDR